MPEKVLGKPEKQRFRQGLWFVVALVAALSALAWLGQHRATAIDRVNWLSDYDQAVTVAADSDRLLLIDFTEPYCPACQLMDLNVFSRQTVADSIEAGYVPIRVNLSDDSSQSLVMGPTLPHLGGAHPDYHRPPRPPDRPHRGWYLRKADDRLAAIRSTDKRSSSHVNTPATATNSTAGSATLEVVTRRTYPTLTRHSTTVKGQI